MARRFLYFIYFVSTLCLLGVFSPPPLYAVVDEIDPSTRQIRYAPHEFIVKYEEGENPNDLAQKATKRVERGRTFFGLLRNVSEDLATRLKRQETPEEAAETLRNLEARTKVVGKEYLFTSWAEKKVLGATSEEETFPFDDYFLLKTSSQVDVATAVKEFQKDSRVEFAEPNYIVRAMLEPDDPYFQQGKMWGLEKIEMPDAWEITTGSENVTVAVLDTGVDYNHKDFEGVNIIKGQDFIQHDNDPMDGHYHGTHVAGTIGAATNNGKGVAGVNWEVTIMAVRVLNSIGEGTTSQILNGIEYAADHAADVINMSLGGRGGNGIMGVEYQNGCPSSWQQMINYARSEGVTVIAAAANDDANVIDYVPASCNGVIAVGASNQSDGRAGFSNWGERIDVAAPGVGIWSLIPRNYLYPLEGTSMAAPHVSGLAALILAQDNSLSPDEVKSRIVDYADSIDTDKPIGPRINAYKSLSAGGEPTPTPTDGATPTPTPTDEPTATPSPGTVTRLDLTVKLQGINSQKRDREMAMTLDSQDYSPLFSADENGHFKGTVEDPGIESGNYTLAVKEAHHLTKEFSVALSGGDNDVVRISTGDDLRAGDIDSDDDVDQGDHDALSSAYSPFSVVDSTVVFADLNEDGYVNSLDYSLLLTNFGGVASPTPTPTPSPTDEPTPTPTATPTDTPTPTPDMEDWTGTVTLNNSQEMPVYVFVAVCVAKGEGEDCHDDFDFYVYREPEPDGSYRFGATVGYYYKTFALATDCKRKVTEDDDQHDYEEKFPDKPCREVLDDYYDTDGPVWVTPPDSKVNFGLDVECVYGEVEEGYMEAHPCEEASDPFAICEPGKGDYNCHAIDIGDGEGWVWDWYKRVAHKAGTPGPCYPDLPECALYTYDNGWGEGCCHPGEDEPSWLPDGNCAEESCGSNGTCDGVGACEETQGD